MIGDGEPAPLLRDMAGNQCLGNLDIAHQPTAGAVDMIVPVDPGIVTAGVIRKRQLLDQSVLRKQMQRPVNGAVRDARVSSPHPLENLASGEMLLRIDNLAQDHRPLGRLPVPSCSLWRRVNAHTVSNRNC